MHVLLQVKTSLKIVQCISEWFFTLITNSIAYIKTLKKMRLEPAFSEQVGDTFSEWPSKGMHVRQVPEVSHVLRPAE